MGGSRPHIHWMPTTSASGNVKWNLEYTMASKDGVYSASTTISAVSPTNSTAIKHIAIEFPTIDGTNVKIGDIFHFRLYRNPSDVQDTYGASAIASSYGVHIEIDGDGSRDVFVK